MIMVLMERVLMELVQEEVCHEDRVSVAVLSGGWFFVEMRVTSWLIRYPHVPSETDEHAGADPSSVPILSARCLLTRWTYA